MSPGNVPESSVLVVPTRQRSLPSPVRKHVVYDMGRGAGGVARAGPGTSSDMVLLLGTILGDSLLLDRCGGETRIERLLSAVRDQTLFATPKDFQ
ncbi:hypothetical protein KIPB_008089, partial [Kipferlia bialata]|eukprot:g8089.t1